MPACRKSGASFSHHCASPTSSPPSSIANAVPRSSFRRRYGSSMSGHQRAISGAWPSSTSRGRSSSRSGRRVTRSPCSSPLTGRDYAGRVKKRVDVLLVERGLAESRAQAQALVLAGRVPGYAKPGAQVGEDAELEVTAPPRYVSRGGEKLAHALDVLGVEVAGRECLDVGASTGGFTDVLLQRGAPRVIALDVGYGQLHERLRADPRVVVLERTNARAVTELPFAPQLVTCDVSFISVRKALPPVLALAAPGWQAVVLVKPQFEAARDEAAKGVVRDPDVRRRVVREVAEAAVAWGGETAGIVDSGLPGPKGNREVFLHLVQRDRPELPPDLDERIRAAVV
jgi:23S rRNA (cytidine1920-2'-O)/16S rRNA (cytidine1409-2'-O)-methyltransferase